MGIRAATMMLGLSLVVFLTAGTAYAQVPKAEDITSCNEKAQSELATASASPRTTGDRAAAGRTTPSDGAGVASGRPADKDATPPKLRSGTPSSADDDPQLQGIDPERANDPAYVAAYKTCMRQAGF
jgi:hypothetical protein